MNGDGLGEFLRARRARLKPADVGMPSSGARRVAGLRREEVAVLAGVSADYYARLEQGRERSPSAPVIDALGAALRLNADAVGHAYRLAGLAPAHAPRASSADTDADADADDAGTGTVTADMVMSLDGCIAGTDHSVANPGGEGADRIGGWIHAQSSWRERSGLDGGAADTDSEIMREWFEATGAVVMDELQLHVLPVLFGAGLRLFDNLGPGSHPLEPIRVVDTPGATHLKYRVLRQP